MVTQRDSFDNWDEKQEFFGLWGTYRPMKGQLADFYFLSLDDNRNRALGSNNIRGDSITHTLGSRIVGDYNQFLYELEGMYQFGQYSNQDLSAFAVASGAGYHFKGAPLNPQFWLRYDFASGDNNLTDGDRTTFNQLFPFGNYYMGWIDRVGRQNIHDFNAQLNLHPPRGQISPRNTTASIWRTRKTFYTTPRDLLPCVTPPDRPEATLVMKSTSVSI